MIRWWCVVKSGLMDHLTSNSLPVKSPYLRNRFTYFDEFWCTTTQNKHKKTKARSSRILRHPAWKRSGSVLKGKDKWGRWVRKKWRKNDKRGSAITNRKLSYRRVTARCVLSVVILPIATQQYRNYLYDKSWPNWWYEVEGLVGGNDSWTMCTQPWRDRLGSHCLRCHKQTDDGRIVYITCIPTTCCGEIF